MICAEQQQQEWKEQTMKRTKKEEEKEKKRMKKRLHEQEAKQRQQQQQTGRAGRPCLARGLMQFGTSLAGAPNFLSFRPLAVPRLAKRPRFSGALGDRQTGQRRRRRR